MPKCEHEYLERERGREESDEIDDGFVELVCARCSGYRVVRKSSTAREADEREVKGGS